MSEEEQMRELHAEVIGEWWWLAGVVSVLIGLLDLPKGLLSPEQTPMLTLFRNSSPPDTYRATVFLGHKAPENTFYGDWKIEAIQHGTLGTITLTGRGDKTAITVTTTPFLVDYWNTLINRVRRAATTAQIVRHAARGKTFQKIIAAYYEALDRGEKPNLREMADTAGVNYDSLRQAKFRYDKKRR